MNPFFYSLCSILATEKGGKKKKKKLNLILDTYETFDRKIKEFYLDKQN